MCGIVGGLAVESVWPELKTVMPSMMNALRHRGPDDGANWFDESARVALGHRRLSILDLSPAGHQPMMSECGRYLIVFNGEIYNHLELRRELSELDPHPNLSSESGRKNGFERTGESQWRGHSDTETLLAAFSRWGVQKTLEKTLGMFAFALWDRRTRTLTLARDRLGEKPLYYGWQGGVFLFGSELKAMKAHPAFRAEIDRGAIALQLRYNCIPTPYSIYKGIRKLWPGTFLQLSLDSDAYRTQSLPEPQPYWSMRQAVEAGQGDPFVGTDTEAEDVLERLLLDAVGRQMVADVPLGAFLSGGVDSSTIVALMQAQSAQPVKTFTIGFHTAGYNEAEHAKAVAQHLGADHTELYVSPREAMDVIPLLPEIYDEPFSDSSQIPTFLVSQMARRHVTVSLSGDAGDEFFGGYNRYFVMRRLWQKASWLPNSIRRGIGMSLAAIPPSVWRRLGASLLRNVPQPDEKVRKVAEVLLAPGPEAVYRSLVSHWKSPEEVVAGATEPATVLMDTERWPNLPEFEHRMMFFDAVSYLPDDILCKVDRAAMAVSLETRVPLLDHRVMEFAWRLPLSMKIRNGQGKWILRQVLYKYVPKELIERPKMGFGVPIDAWLRGPLREWAENLLDESRLHREGYFNTAPIRRKWEEHLSGKRNWQYYLWDVLMFQAWLESNSRIRSA